jgi:hypothetical protein
MLRDPALDVNQKLFIRLIDFEQIAQGKAQPTYGCKGNLFN